MVQKSCPTCCGIGSYLGYKWVQDETGVSIYKKVPVRKSCEACNGTGRMKPAGKLHTHFCNTRSIRRPLRTDSLSLELDQALGYLIFLALVGYASILFLKENFEAAGWIKIALALEGSIVLLFILKHFPVTTRVLRWTTLFVFLGIVCGGVALEYSR
jgi:hypothetical protein